MTEPGQSLAARLARVPKVVHTIHGYGFHAAQPRAQHRAFLALERLAARCTDRFIAVSRANLEEGLARGLFTRDRVSLIRSGIALREFGDRSRGPGGSAPQGGLRGELGLPEDAPLVGMVACLKPQKSPLTFVEVAARVAREVPRAVFVIAGDGELRPAVETRAEQLGLGGRLRLLGWRRDVPRVMASLDVLLHTSLWEGLPRVLPEAIASGVPIVATSVENAPAEPLSALIDRSHRERADRDDVTITVAPGAVGERGIDGGLLIGGLQAEARPARGADRDCVPAHAIGELAHDLVARICDDRGIGRRVEEAGDLEQARDRHDEIIVDRHDHAGDAGNRTAGFQRAPRRFIDG